MFIMCILTADPRKMTTRGSYVGMCKGCLVERGILTLGGWMVKMLTLLTTGGWGVIEILTLGAAWGEGGGVKKGQN